MDKMNLFGNNSNKDWMVFGNPASKSAVLVKGNRVKYNSDGKEYEKEVPNYIANPYAWCIKFWADEGSIVEHLNFLADFEVSDEYRVALQQQVEQILSSFGLASFGMLEEYVKEGKLELFFNIVKYIINDQALVITADFNSCFNLSEELYIEVNSGKLEIRDRNKNGDILYSVQGTLNTKELGEFLFTKCENGNAECYELYVDDLTPSAYNIILVIGIALNKVLENKVGKINDIRRNNYTFALDFLPCEDMADTVGTLNEMRRLYRKQQTK